PTPARGLECLRQQTVVCQKDGLNACAEAWCLRPDVARQRAGAAHTSQCLRGGLVSATCCADSDRASGRTSQCLRGGLVSATLPNGPRVGAGSSGLNACAEAWCPRPATGHTGRIESLASQTPA